MGNKPAPVIQKTPKELQREMNRSIDRMIRDFNRDKMRINMDVMKMKRELEKMIKNGEPKNSQKIIAQNLIKNENFMKKYDTLEAKMKGVKIQCDKKTGFCFDNRGYGEYYERHGSDYGKGNRGY